MTDLSRSLLAAARDGLTPDAATSARVRARVASAVAPTPAAASSSGALLKLAALAVVAGVIATGYAIRRSPHADAPMLALRSNDTETPMPSMRSTDIESPAPSRLSLRAARVDLPLVANTTSRSPRAAVAHEPASLAREVELIDGAMDALRSGSPQDALQTLATFERETLGHAQLAEDAAAINLEARCALHEDVTAMLAAFDAKWPSSAQRARISAACR